MKYTFIGGITLSSEINCMPTGGLTSRRVRVELSEEKSPASVWISELEVNGDIPWLENETRQVKVRIMSDDFRNYVERNLPALSVMRGGDVLGILKFDK